MKSLCACFLPTLRLRRLQSAYVLMTVGTAIVVMAPTRQQQAEQGQGGGGGRVAQARRGQAFPRRSRGPERAPTSPLGEAGTHRGDSSPCPCHEHLRPGGCPERPGFAPGPRPPRLARRRRRLKACQSPPEPDPPRSPNRNVKQGPQPEPSLASRLHQRKGSALLADLCSKTHTAEPSRGRAPRRAPAQPGRPRPRTRSTSRCGAASPNLPRFADRAWAARSSDGCT